MVGVSLHNAKIHPVQDTLATFICKDVNTLKRVQQDWDFSPMFEDVCDYHYAIKFYQNGELKKTLRVNLVCNYILVEGAAYDFEVSDLLKYRPYYRQINWSRITFKDQEVLKQAVKRIEALPNVYPYFDFKPYLFSGFFTVRMDRLPWNANRDSLARAFRKQLIQDYQTREVYVAPGFYIVQGDYQQVRLEVYCEKSFYEDYEEDIQAPWRSHFEYIDQVQLIVVGLSKEGYQKIMEPVLKPKEGEIPPQKE